MKRRKRLSGVMAGICTGIFFIALASPCRAERRLENGCPASSGLGTDKWVCFTLPEAQEIDSRLIDLEALLVAERAKRPKRWGLSVACSVGAGVGLSGDFGLVPPSCGIYYGFALPIGRR